jgi:hypothetical protein
MLDPKRRMRTIALGAIVLAALASLVPSASGRPAIGAAARAQAKRCGQRQVQVVIGKRSACVPVRRLTRGVPHGTDALAVALGRLSRARGGRRSIAAMLGPRAKAIGRWEDQLVLAGRDALRAHGGLAAPDLGPRAAPPAGQEETLQLNVADSPIGWIERAEAFFHKDEGTDVNNTTSTKGTLVAAKDGTSYDYASFTDESGFSCPEKKKGDTSKNAVVQEQGTLIGRRTVKLPRSPEQMELYLVAFTITGSVNRAAQLQSYNITARVTGADAELANNTFALTGSTKNLKAFSGTEAIIAPPVVTLSRGAREGDAALMVDAMNYARGEGLKFLNNAENVFYKEASCLSTKVTKPHVKRGETATEEITVSSRITGKRVESNLTLDATDGAEATPKTAETTPSKAATVKVKMPAAPRGSSTDRFATVAAEPSVAITGLSEQGRAVGTIDSQTLPVALVFDSTIVNTAPPANSGESGSITYHVHAVVPLPAHDQSASSGPLAAVLPASSPLSWVAVTGQHNKAGVIACSPVDQPYSLVETAAALNNGTLRITRSSSTGGDGPAGLTLRIQPSPAPTNQLHSVFQGTCDGLWAPFDSTSTGSSWYHEFLENHLAAVAAGDPCNTTTNGPSCSFDLSGWKPGPRGVYATWQYSRASLIGCPIPGYDCFVSDSTETTTIELLEAS